MNSVCAFFLLFTEIEHRPNKTPSPRMRQDRYFLLFVFYFFLLNFSFITLVFSSWHNMFDVSDRVITDNSLTTYTGHTNEVLGARFSENGAQVVSCGLDNTARVRKSHFFFPLQFITHKFITKYPSVQ